VQVDGAE